MAYDPADDAEDYRRENLDRDIEGQCEECGLRIDDVNLLEVAHDAHGQVFCNATCLALFHSDDTEAGGF